jgi:hypothetical protein
VEQKGRGGTDGVCPIYWKVGANFSPCSDFFLFFFSLGMNGSSNSLTRIYLVRKENGYTLVISRPEPDDEGAIEATSVTQPQSQSAKPKVDDENSLSSSIN